ncbi:uridine kinase [Microbispora corallina]|uniref:Uridine kinase n=1 Tax=Microbispora corallina TaxID=83302 RepID=A0ABQ4G9G8_9ACTN|nr:MULTISPECIES: uridine kinase [Microbispora]ETK35174.1 uridine kinase [Microbispora sp. ATCC PTA-5024]GIH43659.1 uridine kinase [Microbispora corallina]
MRARPVSPTLLVEELADRVAAVPGGGWVRVAVDGAPPAGPGRLADDLVGPLRLRGREALRVPAAGFLRPASLRFEFGRTDPDVFYDEWLDVRGLVREVLGPLGPGRTGRVLPSLWDSERDRATRAGYVTLPPGGVVLVDGALLLGRGLPFDLTVHLSMSPAALARRTADAERWTLPAYERYEREVEPVSTADVVVRVEDPRHPALVTDRE